MGRHEENVQDVHGPAGEGLSRAGRSGAAYTREKGARGFRII